MRIYILLILICFSISCQIDKKEVSPQNLIYYASNYVTDWDVEYGLEDRQKMDIYLRGQKYVDNQNNNVRMEGVQPPTIIFGHGSAWYFSDKRKHEHNISPFLQMGYNVVNLNYSIKKGIPKATHDVRKALLYLLDNNEKYNLDLDNVFLAGESAGAHMASFLGAAQNSSDSSISFSDSINVRGVINIMGGGADCASIYYVLEKHPHEWWRNVGQALVGQFSNVDSILEAYCPVNYFDQYDPPMFIAVGEKDEFGSPEKLHILTSELKKYSIDFTLANYPNSGHGFLTEDYNDMFKRIFLFIEQHKKRSS